MAKDKFDVDTIKKEADITYRRYRGRRGNALVLQFRVWQIRLEVRKVLFLCKEIKRLKAEK